MGLYRLYIDEVGNHDLSHPEDENERFLSLTGVIIDAEYCLRSFNPSFEEIKRIFFAKDPDEPIIFHRKDIMNKRPPFQALRDPYIEKRFNETLLSSLSNWEYQVITVVIDKKAHTKKYQVWHFHPYHYCLSVLLERYVLLLQRGGNTGDVMVESRGKIEDIKLEESFEGLYKRGTSNISMSKFQSYLTSSRLKIKPKSANICGLQLADLLAHPSRREILIDHGLIIKERNVFGDQITEILRKSKYNRNNITGKMEGYGKKLLP